MVDDNKKTKEEMIRRWRKILAKKRAKMKQDKFQTTDEITMQVGLEGYE